MLGALVVIGREISNCIAEQLFDDVSLCKLTNLYVFSFLVSSQLEV